MLVPDSTPIFPSISHFLRSLLDNPSGLQNISLVMIAGRTYQVSSTGAVQEMVEYFESEDEGESAARRAREEELGCLLLRFGKLKVSDPCNEPSSHSNDGRSKCPPSRPLRSALTKESGARGGAKQTVHFSEAVETRYLMRSTTERMEQIENSARLLCRLANRVHWLADGYKIETANNVKAVEAKALRAAETANKTGTEADTKLAESLEDIWRAMLPFERQTKDLAMPVKDLAIDVRDLGEQVKGLARAHYENEAKELEALQTMQRILQEMVSAFKLCKKKSKVAAGAWVKARRLTKLAGITPVKEPGAAGLTRGFYDDEFGSRSPRPSAATTSLESLGAAAPDTVAIDHSSFEPSPFASEPPSKENQEDSDRREAAE